MFLLSIAILLMLSSSDVNNADNLSSTKTVTFYPTYAYSDGDQWRVPVRVYVNESRSVAPGILTRIVRSRADLNPEETAILRRRLSHFTDDSKSRERVEFMFDQDPDSIRYQIQNERGRTLRTDINGLMIGEIVLSNDKVTDLLRRQGADDQWLVIRVVSQNHSGRGLIRIIQPEGVSVVSDIDDTIKITEMPAGSRVVIRNTFFKEYSATPGMAGMYREWGDIPFHYVSGAPWQLFRPLTNFLFSEAGGFPVGTMHMKTVRKNLRSLNSWRDLRELATNENVTFDQKIAQINTIFLHFPDRQFILVGDSGEKDPEIYREIANRYPDQIKEIIIRDVVNHRELRPDRLEGMTIIPAETFVRAGGD